MATLARQLIDEHEVGTRVCVGTRGEHEGPCWYHEVGISQALQYPPLNPVGWLGEVEPSHVIGR